MKLEEWMKARALNDREVALTLGIDRATISRLRRGRQRPLWPLLERIVEMTEGAVKPDDFLFNKDAPNEPPDHNPNPGGHRVGSDLWRRAPARQHGPRLPDNIRSPGVTHNYKRKTTRKYPIRARRFTPEQVAEIRQSREPRKVLAFRYGVSKVTIFHVLRGHS
jgi:transcriptional regulator with XRE-family HTH domain